MYETRWNRRKNDELPSEKEQDLWFRNIVRMQKMQVELDLCRNKSINLDERRDEDSAGEIPNFTKETTENKRKLQSESQDDVHKQCSGLVIV